MYNIMKNAFATAQKGMDRAHDAMQANVGSFENYQLAYQVFQRHMKIAKYLRQRRARDC